MKISGQCAHGRPIADRCPICYPPLDPTIAEREAARDLRRVLEIHKREDLVFTEEDPDLFGNTQFNAWFEKTWPRPKTKAQQSNWKYKRDMAHAGWVKCEQLARETIRRLKETKPCA